MKRHIASVKVYEDSSWNMKGTFDSKMKRPKSPMKKSFKLDSVFNAENRKSYSPSPKRPKTVVGV
jgi:hypothetical protein